MRGRLGTAAALLLVLAFSTARLGAQEELTSFGEGVRFSGKEVFEAFAKAWPGRFSSIGWSRGDWVVRLDDQWFRWAEGRLLPLAEKEEGDWAPWPFYSYPAGLPPVKKLDVEEKKALDAQLAIKDARPEKRNPAFFDLLFHAPDHNGAWDRMKTILLFGREVLVNPDILEELAAVERDIKAEAKTDEAVARWVSSIGNIEGFAWRSIAGTASRSMHSYGVAIDIVPARAKGLSWYWLDARKLGLSWYELPRSRRIPVPIKVVQAFERRGFVWGGKWFYWDLVHFEYRPDILILNGLDASVQASVK